MTKQEANIAECEGLIVSILTGEGTGLEQARLDELLDYPEVAAYLQARMFGELSDQRFSLEALNPSDQALYEKIRERIEAGVRRNIRESAQANEQNKAPVRSLYLRLTAAAAILILVAGSWWFFGKNGKIEKATLSMSDVAAPDRNRAMVTLGDGRTVYLDQVGNGELADINGLKLVKTADGQLVYEGATNVLPVENVVSNPKGSKVIDLTLTDGTKVWLNAGSSIRYYVPFVERNIQIEGEAYFEVAKDAKHPFSVTQGTTNVEVLGTHFNVKAYGEDKVFKVTLIEGSVNVKGKNETQRLKVGEQAILSEVQGHIQLVKQADIEEALAWKNGYTSFHGVGLETFLNEISRWYGVEIVMKADRQKFTEESFYGDVKRTASLSDVLKVLSDSKIGYTIDEQKKQLTITP
jgi:transmembrane sensor